MPASLRRMLLAEFAEEQAGATPWLTAEDLYEVAGFMDAGDLMELASLDLPDLKDPPFHPVDAGAAGRGPPRVRGDPRG